MFDNSLLGVVVKCLGSCLGERQVVCAIENFNWMISEYAQWV
jgi:hypothetical protein